MVGIAQKIVIPVQQLFKSTVIRDFLIFSGGSLLRRGISVLLAPLTLTLVTPAEYGLLALANTAISIITVFIGLGLRQSFQLDYFHCSTIERKKMINDIIIIYMMIAAPFFIVLIFLYHWFSCNALPPLLTYISIVICFIYFFVEFFYQLLKCQCRAWFITILQLTIAFITVCFTLFFLWHLRLGVVSILLGQLIGMALVCIIALRMYIQKTCHHFFEPHKGTKKITTYLTRSLPFLPSVLFALLLASSDRWILAHYATMHDVGIYALANTFVQLFQLLILQPMTISYIPHTLNNFVAQKDTIITLEKNNRMTMYVSMVGLAFIITVGFLFSKSLLYALIPRAYHEAIGYVWFLLISYIFLFGTYFSTILIQCLQKRLFMSCVFIGPACLNIVLNLSLVPHYGINGCVVATFISYLSYFLITMWYGNYLIKKLIKPRQYPFNDSLSRPTSAQTKSPTILQQ